ncbi:MAG: DUF1836 domain-containing protein [Eubacteriales bacterium]|jgi:hypothetical protein|nr:DUF1836 domain-containing protein [Eubacteriales bacterium]MDD3290348.1 DUF1836 domain-containing protein [Eubacteriales bacterium]MDD3863869.1 DUF1836 domain-containing protein [Eubacteriales bacterium]MDD4444515.1 DUF1836 domain-containing protein [Eubacteriales bacterium]
MRYEEYAKKLADDYLKSGIIDGKNFPDIELYIDQMAKCLNQELRLYGDGKSTPITKAMISNYTKHQMIPGPVGKHYTKDHLIFMTLVFYLKGCFSMEEIRRLMKPLLDNYSSEWDEPIDFVSMYAEIIDFVRKTEADLPRRLEQQISDVKKFLANRDTADDDTSELMMLVTTLVMRSNAERFIAEKLLDEYFENLKKGSKKK